MESSTDDNPATITATATATTPITVRNLNDFPEHLLLHILSLLPTIDAIKTSSISRKWRNLWSSIPSLYFSYDLFPPSECPYETCHRFSDSVNRTLLRRRQSPLHTFRLEFDFIKYKYSSLIESWIRYAVNRGVHNLDVDFFIDHRFHTYHPQDEMYFDFPFFALRNGKVRVLKLKHCDVTLPTYMNTVKFPSLLSVFISQSHFTDKMVSDLLVGCPNIESLSLHFCYGMYNVKICSYTIKELSLRYVQGKEGSTSSVEIDCPDLRKLDFLSYEVEKYSLKNTSAVVEAHVSFLQLWWYYKYWSKVVPFLGNVSKLKLANCWWFKLLELKDVSAGSLKFPNLRWLEMQTGYSKSEVLGIAALLEISPNLDMLILDYNNFKVDEDGSISEEMLNKPINLSLPRLRQAKMKTFLGSEDELLFLNLLKNQGVVCQKILVLPIKYDKIPYRPVVWVRNPDGTFVEEPSPHLEDVSQYFINMTLRVPNTSQQVRIPTQPFTMPAYASRDDLARLAQHLGECAMGLRKELIRMYNRYGYPIEEYGFDDGVGPSTMYPNTAGAPPPSHHPGYNSTPGNCPYMDSEQHHNLGDDQDDCEDDD